MPLRLPTTVAVAADGRVFVADGVNHRVAVFDAEGAPLGEIADADGTRLNTPVGVRVDGQGRVCVADTGNRRVLLYSLDLELIVVVAAPVVEGRPVDVTDALPLANGALWLIDNDNHRLWRGAIGGDAWREVGRVGETLGQFQYPFLIAPAAGGDLVVSDVMNSRAQLLTADGRAVRAIGTYGVEIGQLYRPGGVAVDADGRVWIADSVLGVVQVFGREGAVIDVLRDAAGAPLRFEGPLGLAFDAAGALYVVESQAHRVRKIEVSPTTRAGPPPRPARTAARGGQQARSCTICHLEWIPPFVDGRDSTLLGRPDSRADDPIAARSAMCLSCHDGSVADSRYAVWAEHGHRTGVTPPADMVVPATLPLVDGTVACRTCHTAHGPGAAETDISKIVLLRGRNAAGELCVSCHVDKTRGPMFGTHPTGGMPWPVPQRLIDAGARVGPNPRELTCQVCHTAHGARFDHLLVEGTKSSQLCLACHDQMRPGMFREGAPSEHPLSPPVNDEQAAAIEQLGTRLGDGDRLICLSCHKLHHGKGERFLLADDLTDGRFCLHCHSERSDVLGSAHDLRATLPEERNRLGMRVIDGGPCSACHLFHRYARELRPTELDAPGHCASCHSEGQCAGEKSLGAFNHPSNHCTDCHNPHETRFGKFLTARPEDVCSRCHSEKMSLVGSGHDAHLAGSEFCGSPSFAGDRCLACHQPHAEQPRGLLRTAPLANQADADAACLPCHSDAAWSGGGALAVSHPRQGASISPELPLIAAADGSGSMIGCVTCHDPHGNGLEAAGLPRAPAAGATDVCTSCHSDMAAITASAHSPTRLAANQLDATACGPCHQPHGSGALLWAASVAGDAHRVSGTAGHVGDRYCVDCHRAGGPAAAPAVASHPDVPMFDPVAASGRRAPLPLYDASGRVSASGAIECRTCHNPHGRELPPGTPAEKAAALRIQLRPFEQPNVCTHCHGADALWRFLYFHEPNRRSGPATVSAAP